MNWRRFEKNMKIKRQNETHKIETKGKYHAFSFNNIDQKPVARSETLCTRFWF